MTAATSLPAFGSTAVVVTSDPDRLGDAVARVRDTVEAFDAACSRFREDSELSECNRAGGRPTRVSSLLIEAVRAGIRAAELTDGDVDPALGAALVALGYDKDFDLGFVARGAERDGRAVGLRPPTVAVASVPGWRTIRVESEASTVQLGHGVALDLGATAKALAADHAAAAAFESTGCGVLVGFGGDLATAGPSPADGWEIRVTDDHRSPPSAPGQSITIRSGAVATSSTTVRRWRTEGHDVHHLLDPVTGLPVAGGWRTITVAASSCLDANIASTAAIVRGESAADWLAELGLPSRLVGDDGVARHVAGWPVERDDLAPVAA